jgi:hypothetical protein
MKPKSESGFMLCCWKVFSNESVAFIPPPISDKAIVEYVSRNPNLMIRASGLLRTQKSRNWVLLALLRQIEAKTKKQIREYEVKAVSGIFAPNPNDFYATSNAKMFNTRAKLLSEKLKRIKEAKSILEIVLDV